MHLCFKNQLMRFFLKRTTLINLHLYFSGISLFLLLVFIFSGSLHLLGVSETETKSLVKTYDPSTMKDFETPELFLEQSLQAINPSYSFDYIKGRGGNLTTRPTTRTFYTLATTEKSIEIYKHVPGVTKRFMELHKGHGPKATRKILGGIAMIFALAIFTGAWLGLTTRAYRKTTLITGLSSALIVLLLFNL